MLWKELALFQLSGCIFIVAYQP